MQHTVSQDLTAVQIGTYAANLAEDAWFAALPPPTFSEWLEAEAEKYDALGTCAGRVVAAELRELGRAADSLQAETAEDFEARDEVMRRA